MKKKEMMILAVLALISLAVIGWMRFGPKIGGSGADNRLPYVYADEKDGPYASAEMPDWEPSGQWVAVVWRSSRVLLYFDSGVDGEYTVEGNIGHMHIEVKDNMWHVKDVDCYDYTCKNMGWMGKDSFLPIICLPNDLVIIDAETAQNMTGGGK